MVKRPAAALACPWWLAHAGWFLLVAAQVYAIATSPPDRDMGHLQKILYVHVPSAWNAFIAFFVVAIASLLYLWKGRGTARPAGGIGRRGRDAVHRR